jgi:NAD(P)-dependent dehydrogenase (short-subunit alcohol dehydrogenase family)
MVQGPPDRQGSHRHRRIGEPGEAVLAGPGVGRANVLVHYRDADRADEAQDVVNDLKERGAEAIGYQADLTSNAEITRLVDAAVERFGHWDILVNTAGLIVRKPVAETTEEEYDQSFAINAKIPRCMSRSPYKPQGPPGDKVAVLWEALTAHRPWYMKVRS